MLTHRAKSGETELPELSLFSCVACLYQDFVSWMQSPIWIRADRKAPCTRELMWCWSQLLMQVRAKMFPPKPHLMRRQPGLGGVQKCFFKTISFLLSGSCSCGHKTLYFSFHYIYHPEEAGKLWVWGWVVFCTSFETIQLEAKFSGDTQEKGIGDDSLSWLT